jgi:predicted ATP-grasp superfamily ATP-dependent carboligase
VWGNRATALRRARNPEFVTESLRAAGLPAPRIWRAGERSDPGQRWLNKPRKSAGGSGIHFTEEETSDGPGTYQQEYIEGRPCSLLFVGDGRQARLLGMTWQLVGLPFLHAGPFRYCGSIGPVDSGIIRYPSLAALGDVLARACGLCGLFGVDGVLREDVFWPVEINPRYTSSIEVLEYATGVLALSHHAAVFTHRTLPPPIEPAASDRPVGKAILFARADLVFPAEGPWLAVLRAPSPLDDMPAFADIPAAGQHIPAGRPILTCFARAGSPSACEGELRRIAADLDRWLFER